MNVDTFTMLQLEQESRRLEAEIGAKHCELADKTARLTQVRAEIAKRNKPSPEPRLSDHAVLRYLERGCGVDVQGVRKLLLSADIVRQIKLGATSITVNGITFPVQNRVIITGLDSTMRPVEAMPVRGVK